MEWPSPWQAVVFADERAGFETELLRELNPGHTLFGIPVIAIGLRQDQDDVLFEFQDGSGRVVEVHLTWAGEHEKPPWPSALVFANLVAWTESVREENP